jgi:hypothetical protein
MASGEGSISISPSAGTSSTYKAGTLVTLTAIPASGWEFNHWEGNIGGNENPYSLKMNSNKSVLAYFIDTSAPCHDNDLNWQLEWCKEQLATQWLFPAETYDRQEIENSIIGVVADARAYLESLDHNGLTDIQLGTANHTLDNYHLVCSVDEGKEVSLIVLLELFEELREEKYDTLLIQNIQLPASKTEISFDIGFVTQ